MPNESKTLVTQLQEAQAACDAFKLQVAAFETGKVDMQAKIDALTKEIEGVKASHSESVKALESEKTDHAKTRAELDGAKARLAHPGFADAASKGSANAGHDGGVAGDQSSESMTKAEAQAAYAKISDPKAKKAFRVANWKALGINEEK